MKRCGMCHETKPLDAFSKDCGKRDGRCSRCRECWKTYYAANRERVAEYKAAARGAAGEMEIAA